MEHLLIDGGLQPHPNDFIRRNTEVVPTSITATTSYNQSAAGQLIMENLLDASLKKRQGKNAGDILEQVQFFKDIKNAKDRKSLKEGLSQETFEPGEVIFNYDDIGDKFYVVLEGEIVINFPDPEIEPTEFKERYGQYQLLLQQIEDHKLLEKKKSLVEKRRQTIEELLEVKGSIMDSQKSLKLPEKGKVTTRKRSAMKRRYEMKQDLGRKTQSMGTKNSIFFKDPNSASTIGMNEFSAADEDAEQSKSESSVSNLNLVGIAEVGNSDDDDYNDRFKSYQEHFEVHTNVNRINEHEMEELGEHFKSMFHNKLHEVEVKQVKPTPTTESDFDKLRRRVAYLSYNKRHRQPTVPYNMQIHGRFLSDDAQRKLDARRGSQQSQESESDESIKAIKREHKRNEAKIDLNTLSEMQISKLSMKKIEHLVMEPKILTTIPPEQYDEVLATEWLKPGAKYKKFSSFGERALTDPDNKRAGTAIAKVPTKVVSLTKNEYKKFLEKINLKEQAKVNSFLKSLPYFQYWASRRLVDIQIYLKPINLIRNQVIYREGEVSKYIYLIEQGEVLLTKRVPAKFQHQVQLDKLIGPNQTSLMEVPKIEDMKVINSALGDLGPKSAAQVNPEPGKTGQQTLAKTKMHGAFKLITLMTGQLFGDEDIYQDPQKDEQSGDQIRKSTATCISQTAIVRRIEKEEFQKRIMSNEETKNEIKLQVYQKQGKIEERLKMIEGVYNISAKEIYAAVELERKTQTKSQAELQLHLSSMPSLKKASSKDAHLMQVRQSHQKHQGGSPQSFGQMNNSPSPYKQQSVAQRQQPHHHQKQNSQGSPMQTVSDFGNNSIGTTQRDLQMDTFSRQPTPKKKKLPNYMKSLSSKEPVKPIKREPKGANKVIVEAFDIPEVEEFRPLNNTRKVHYPMMLEKYQVKKHREIYDDFREAMSFIVSKNNDELFSENLIKKSGRTAAKPSHDDFSTTSNKHVNSVYLDMPLDRTDPQRVMPRGFYSQSRRQNYQDTNSLKSAAQLQFNESNMHVSQTGLQRHHMRTPELPKMTKKIMTAAPRHASISNVVNQPRHGGVQSGLEDNYGEYSFTHDRRNQKTGNLDLSYQSVDLFLGGGSGTSNNDTSRRGGAGTAVEYNDATNLSSVNGITNLPLSQHLENRANSIPTTNRLGHSVLSSQGQHQNGSFIQTQGQVQRPWMMQQRLLNKGNYSYAPSKIFMARNDGKLPPEQPVIEKQFQQQQNEQRRSQLMNNSLPARILAHKTVKYANVASTIKRGRPARLEKLNI